MCWSHEHALYLDLSCSMPGASGEHLWAAASAVLGSSSVRKAGFKLRDQLAALLQHGIKVRHGVLLCVIFIHTECNALSATSSAFHRVEQDVVCCAEQHPSRAYMAIELAQLRSTLPAASRTGHRVLVRRIGSGRALPAMADQ